MDLGSPFVSVGELKQMISKKKKIDKNTDLIITNAQTNEEYKEETKLVQKNTSVIVKLVPLFSQNQVLTNAQKDPNKIKEDFAKKTTQTFNKEMQNNYGELKQMAGQEDDFGPATWENNQPKEVATTVVTSSSEEDKIKDLIDKASNIPVSSTYNKSSGSTKQIMPGQRKVPPPGYVCYRCNLPGHFIYECPTNGDPAYNVQRKTLTMHGVPKSFLTPSDNGRVLEFRPNENVFYQAIKHSGRTENLERKLQEIPKEFICPICKKIMSNASMAPCCTESACDDCFRSILIEKNEFICPLCSQPLTPDQLLPNKALRRGIEKLQSGFEDNVSKSPKETTPVRTPPPTQSENQQPSIEVPPTETKPVDATNTSDKSQKDDNQGTEYPSKGRVSSYREPSRPNPNRKGGYYGMNYDYYNQGYQYYASPPVMSKDEFLAEQEKARRMYDVSRDPRVSSSSKPRLDDDKHREESGSKRKRSPESEEPYSKKRRGESSSKHHSDDRRHTSRRSDSRHTRH